MKDNEQPFAAPMLTEAQISAAADAWNADGPPGYAGFVAGAEWALAQVQCHAPTSDAKRAQELAEELEVTEKLLAQFQRVLDAIPPCPVHGSCVAHALEWIEKAKAVARRCAELCDQTTEHGALDEHGETKAYASAAAIRKEFGLEEEP